MKCPICEDFELYINYSYSCAKCFLFFTHDLNKILGYDINGDPKIFLSIKNNSDIFINNYYTKECKLVIKVDIKNLTQKEIYELLRNIANNLEFL